MKNEEKALKDLAKSNKRSAGMLDRVTRGGAGVLGTLGGVVLATQHSGNMAIAEVGLAFGSAGVALDYIFARRPYTEGFNNPSNAAEVSLQNSRILKVVGGVLVLVAGLLVVSGESDSKPNQTSPAGVPATAGSTASNQPAIRTCEITTDFNVPETPQTEADAVRLVNYLNGLVLPGGEVLPTIPPDQLESHDLTRGNQASLNIDAIQRSARINPDLPWNNETCLYTAFGNGDPADPPK